MTTKNFVVKNGLQVGNVIITAANSFITAANANLGNAVVANFFIGSGANLSNINAANIVGNISGNISNANFASFAGVVTTNAQPNITSVGNLTGLTVNGNLSTNAIFTDNYYHANGSPIDFQQTGGSNTDVQFNNNGNFGGSNAFTFNSTSNVLTLLGNLVTNNANLGNLVTANFANLANDLVVTGNANISLLLTGNTANFSGNVIAANVYANSGTIGANLLTGTLTTAAQPNITSVGNLTSLTIAANGNITMSGNSSQLSGANLLSASFLTGTLTTNAQPNITTVGNLSYLDVVGNITTNANIVTDLIAGKTTGVTITAAGSNTNITLKPNGTGFVDTYGAKVSNIGTPTASTDAATKLYVDEVAQGLDPKASVEYATAAALPAFTYNNGTSGVGATITANAFGALSIDGSSPSANARVLIKNETSTNQPYNGIYVVTTVGDGSTAFVLTRANDFDGAPGSEIPGAFVFVEAGATMADTGWVCITNAPVTVGTTNIVFTQFAGAGTYTAGTGLTLTGTVFSISNTAVTAGSYGNGDYVATFTVNQQGQLTAASNTAIAANAANLTGTTLNSSVVTSSLTSVGTLGNLAVTGNTTSGNVYANSGTISANLLTGTLTTAAQPNITSLGNLANLTITGFLSGNTANFSGNLIAANANLGNLVEANLVDVTSTIRSNNITVNLALTGNTANFSGNLIAANGNLGNLVLANFANFANDVVITGNANVNLTLTGNVANFSGNLTAANGNLGNLVTANYANFANDVVISGNANVNLTLTGNVANFSGNLTAANGNLGNLVTANFANIASNLVVSGNASVNLDLTGNTANFSGNLIAANANLGNLAVANYVTGTLTTNAQPNITSVGTLTSLTTSGNITAQYARLNKGLTSNRSNVSVTTNTVLDEFATSAFRTAKYVFSASGDNGFQSVEALLVHDNADSYITIYGSVCSNVTADIIEIGSNVDVGTGNVTVYASSNSANAVVNLVASYILT